MDAVRFFTEINPVEAILLLGGLLFFWAARRTSRERRTPQSRRER